MLNQLSISDVKSALARMESLAAHQRDPHMHPLTCGNDSGHGLLYPAFDGSKVVLVCPDCEYRQEMSDTYGVSGASLKELRRKLPKRVASDPGFASEISNRFASDAAPE